MALTLQAIEACIFPSLLTVYGSAIISMKVMLPEVGEPALPRKTLPLHLHSSPCLAHHYGSLGRNGSQKHCILCPGCGSPMTEEPQTRLPCGGSAIVLYSQEIDSAKDIGYFFLAGGGFLNCSNGLLFLSNGPRPPGAFLNYSKGLLFLSKGPSSSI